MSLVVNGAWTTPAMPAYDRPLRTRLTKLPCGNLVRVAAVDAGCFSETSLPVHGFIEQRTIFSAEAEADRDADRKPVNLVHMHFIRSLLLQSLQQEGDMFEPELVLRDSRLRLSRLLVGLLFPWLKDMEDDEEVGSLFIIPDMDSRQLQLTLAQLFGEPDASKLDSTECGLEEEYAGAACGGTSSQKHKTKVNIFVHSCNLYGIFEEGKKLSLSKPFLI